MSESQPEYAPVEDAGLFGFNPSLSQQELTVIGVPWEPTTSYGRGCSRTPKAIIRASHQLDLFEPFLNREFGQTVAMAPLRQEWIVSNAACIDLADPILAKGGRLTPRLERNLDLVNESCVKLNDELEHQVMDIIAKGRAVAVLGGDHASPLGAICAHAKHFPKMGLLHVDAHHDLREAYLGFQYSHASIMFNVLKEAPFDGPLVSVGIRDYSQQEWQLAKHHPKIITHYDRDLKQAQFRGQNWSKTVANILDPLPAQVYISFDIDGLDPKLCPHTGTPVPGGLNFNQACFLLEAIAISGRHVIGFDLCEVTPGNDDWDLNVGARILHKLAAITCFGL